MKKYKKNKHFYSICTKILMVVILALMISVMLLLLKHSLTNVPFASPLVPALDRAARVVTGFGAILLVLAVVIEILTPNTFRIVRMVKNGLFDSARGNPLNLREGELLPKIRCKRTGEGLYDLTISAQQSVTVDTIKAAAPSISAALTHRFQQYAVVAIGPDTAFNCVTFRLEDVKVDRSLTFKTVEEMRTPAPFLIQVDKVTNIDLTTSGSILLAGKTRSGKTTGAVALLTPILLAGPDPYESTVLIIDPKQAELSRLPYTVTLDNDGEARTILDRLKGYVDTITHRQQILNDMSERSGRAVRFWDAGLHPSFIFIDEFVTLRGILPQKAEKGSDYCLDTFDKLLKRICTTGSSAGCFAAVSIAEASVQQGGLPAMLRSAMSTRVLFRPTMDEGKLIWDAEKLANLPSRVYGPGDAWFSSTDGIHDVVSYVHFPQFEFPIYGELGRLLKQYYEGK